MQEDQVIVTPQVLAGSGGRTEMSSEEAKPLLRPCANNSTFHRTVEKLKVAYHPTSLTAVKPIHRFLSERDDKPKGKSLAEELGFVDLVGYGVGCTVGAGIYSLIGVGAGIAGPGILISYLIGAISCVFTALAYSEFAARVPVAWSAYTYAYASFGELLAWMIGWDLTLEYSISAAVIARSWGDYFAHFWTLWGLNSPYWLNNIDIGFTVLSPAAAGIVILCTVVMLFGIRNSSTFNVIITILNVFVLLFFIGTGASSVNPSNWTVVNHSFVPYGVASLFTGAGTVFFSYIGFDMVSSLAEETKNPQKNLPRGIIASLFIAAIIYVGVSLVATGIVPFTALAAHKAPLAYALEEIELDWAAKVISFGSLFGLTTATFTCLLGQPRIFYTMARDGLLFPFFQWTTKTEIPFIGTLLSGVLAAVIAFCMPLYVLADAISIGTLLAFNLVCAGVLILRYKGGSRPYIPILVVVAFVVMAFICAIAFERGLPIYASAGFGVVTLLLVIPMCFFPVYNMPNGFKCPLVPLVPCIGIGINMYMLAGLNPDSWIRVGIWLVIGLCIYGFYGIWNSRMRPYNAPSFSKIINKT